MASLPPIGTSPPPLRTLLGSVVSLPWASQPQPSGMGSPRLSWSSTCAHQTLTLWISIILWIAIIHCSFFTAGTLNLHHQQSCLLCMTCFAVQIGGSSYAHFQVADDKKREQDGILTWQMNGKTSFFSLFSCTFMIYTRTHTRTHTHTHTHTHTGEINSKRLQLVQGVDPNRGSHNLSKQTKHIRSLHSSHNEGIQEVFPLRLPLEKDYVCRITSLWHLHCLSGSR